MDSYKVLKFICENLNDFLKVEFMVDSRKVELNKVKDIDGSTPSNNLNMVILSLVNVEEEISTSFQPSIPNNAIHSKHYFSIFIMVSAIFDEYDEALKYIDAVVKFFSNNPVFAPNSRPNFPTELSKINLEHVNLSMVETLKIWSYLGASYQPSVIYKIRFI